jgi:hypothetical protein
LHCPTIGGYKPDAGPAMAKCIQYYGNGPHNLWGLKIFFFQVHHMKNRLSNIWRYNIMKNWSWCSGARLDPLAVWTCVQVLVVILFGFLLF